MSVSPDPQLETASDEQPARQRRPPAQQDERLLPRVGKFVAATIKLGLAIGIGLCVLTGIGALAVVGNQKRQESQRQDTLKPLRHVKQWLPSEVLNSLRATIQTKWGDNDLLVRMTLADVPAQGLIFEDGARFILHFMDADGFNVIEHTIPTSELSRTLEGETTKAYEWQGSVSTSPEAYARAQSWTMLWSGVRLAKPVVTAPTVSETGDSAVAGRWKVRANWRKLRSGMHEGEVRRLLGDPTYVEVAVYKYWVYGGRSWALYPHVRFSEGAVDAWQEP